MRLFEEPAPVFRDGEEGIERFERAVAALSRAARSMGTVGPSGATASLFAMNEALVLVLVGDPAEVASDALLPCPWCCGRGDCSGCPDSLAASAAVPDSEAPAEETKTGATAAKYSAGVTLAISGE
jgi:hypothetical protein